MLTIIYGIICSILYIPFILTLSHLGMQFDGFNLILYCFVILYALLLCKFAQKQLISVFFPMLFFGITGYWVESRIGYIILSFILLTWIRTSICFDKFSIKSIIVEGFVSLIGACLFILLNPYTNLTWAIGIWLFFLLQTIYTILTPLPNHSNGNEEYESHRFEHAKSQIEKILAT